MVLFVCESKYQLLNAINIRKSMGVCERIDLCISDKLGYFERMIKSISDSGVFDNIYYFKPPYRPLQDRLSMMKKMFRSWNIVSFIHAEIPDLSYEYEKVYISGSGLSCIGVYYYLRKRNKTIKLCLYEDGVCEYLCYTWESNWYRRLYSKIFYGTYYLDDVSEMYVYAPDLIVDKPKLIKTFKIPYLNSIADIHQTINTIFEYDNTGLEILKSCKCLFIDVDFTDEYSSSCQYEIVERLYAKLGNKLIVKIHPRSEKDKYNKIGVTCLETKQIMELIMLNYSFNDLVFVSSISSAIFNLKNVFNMTPKLILLNNLFKTLNNRGVNLYIEKFKNSYPSEKLHQPLTVDELVTAI